MGALTKINGKWVPVNSFCKQNGKWVPHNLNYWKEGGAWNVPKFKIYGVRVKESEPDPYKRVEYTDDAIRFTPASGTNMGSWAGSPLLADIKPVMFDGTTWTDLDKRNLSRDVNGNPVDIATIGHDVFTEIRPWWFSVTHDSTYTYYRLANKKVDDSYSKLASLWNGKDVGAFHRGCFHALVENWRPYSSPNHSPTVNFAFTNFLNGANARKVGYDVSTFSQMDYIKVLWLLLYKTCDCKTFGKGRDVNTPGVENVTVYSNDYGMKVPTSSDNSTSFLWMNEPWNNVVESISGIKINGSQQVEILANGEPGQSTAYKPLGMTYMLNGNIQTMHGTNTETAFIPKQSGGTNTTYWCGYTSGTTNTIPCISGGLFDVNAWVSSTGAYTNVGSRLAWRAGRPGVEPI